MRLAEWLFGPVANLDRGTVSGALGFTVYHGLNLLYLYVVAAFLLRERPSRKAAEEPESTDRTEGGA
jgi:hypothetical protein